MATYFTILDVSGNGIAKGAVIGSLPGSLQPSTALPTGQDLGWPINSTQYPSYNAAVAALPALVAANPNANLKICQNATDPNGGAPILGLVQQGPL